MLASDEQHDNDDADNDDGDGNDDDDDDDEAEDEERTYLPARSTRLRAPCRRCPEASCWPVMNSVKTE